MNCRQLASFIMSAAAAVGLLFAETHSAEAGQRALLVGVGAYPNVKSLIGPARDVERMEQFLTEHWGFAPEDIAILRDHHATRQGILDVLEYVVLGTTEPGDRVVIYFSGLGTQVTDTNGDELDGLDEALVTVEASADGNEGRFTDDEFDTVLERLADRNVTVIIDACHSASKAESPNNQALTRSLAGPKPAQEPADVKAETFATSAANRTVWSASSTGQDCWEAKGEGLFTRHFVKGAAYFGADSNGNGLVSKPELVNYIRTETQKWCEGEGQCNAKTQTAVLETPEDSISEAVVPRGKRSTAPTDLLVHDNRADVHLDILPATHLKIGTVVKFKVTSARPGLLVLLDINADGNVTQLVPNQIMEQNNRPSFVLADRPIVVPDAYYGFEFTVQPPLGGGLLVAIVAEDEVDLRAIVDPHNKLEQIGDGSLYLGQLARKLLEVWDKDGGRRELNWSLAVANYTVFE